jgi:hypothetical protein
MKKKYQQVKRDSVIRHHTMLGDFGGCGMIRVVLPYIHLSQYKKDATIIPTYDMYFTLDPRYFNGMPFLQFQRSVTPPQLEILRHFKKNISTKTGTKIVYELDDDITGVPKWNHAHEYYDLYKDTILKFFEEVDFIVCSTQKLANKLNKYNKTRVIKNRLSFQWRNVYRKWNLSNSESKRKKILWAGSQTHFDITGKEGDFDKKFLNYIKETQDRFEWIFVGAIPNQLKDVNVTVYPWINYLQFPIFLYSLNVDIGIAPLQQIPFNESKSNIKALEFAALGVPGVYSNVDPYNNMSLLANNSDEFINHIENLSTNDDLRYETRNKDYETLKDELFWDNDYCKFYLNMYLREIGKQI